MATSQLSQTAVGEALLSIALLPERSQLTTSQTRTVVPGWEVRRRLVIGPFSFHKEVMYRDLLKNEEKVSEHPLVRALAVGAREAFGLDFDVIPEDRLDEDAPPESIVTILDADATQLQCITAAAAGRSFVMDGPPGTGKSQTIANMIAELLANGKTVLFVSEKAAALEVVHKRLHAAGLDDYCLGRVAGGISAPGPHRSGRESLDSSGSCRTIVRTHNAASNARTAGARVSARHSATLVRAFCYVSAAYTSSSPSAPVSDRCARRVASPHSDRTR